MLLGAEEVRMAGQDLWRTARDSGNELIRDLNPTSTSVVDVSALLEKAAAVGSRAGTVGESFLNACRADLQE